MAQGFYRETIDELKLLGFIFYAHAKGSHEKWKSKDGQILIVPRNLPKRHTANAILKQAGSTKKF